MHDPTQNNSCKLQRGSARQFHPETQIPEVEMTRFAALIAASALFATPAIAATYSAKPIAAPSQTKIIGKDISWSYAGGSFHGATDASRPQIICQDLAKRAGRLESFVTDGQPLGTAELDKCNAKAGAPTALAKAN
jgi:hypothetical protein